MVVKVRIYNFQQGTAAAVYEPFHVSLLKLLTACSATAVGLEAATQMALATLIISRSLQTFTGVC